MPFFTEAAVGISDVAGANSICNFPVNVNPGDIFVAIFIYKASTSSGITWPGDFNEFQAESGASGVTIWEAWHLCDGSEGGTTFQVDHASTTTMRFLLGWAFRGCDPADPIESIDLTRGTDASIEQDPVIGRGLNRLGVAISALGDDFVPSDFVGEVGGDWEIEDYQSTTAGNDAACQMWAVPMPNVATVRSGVSTIVGGATTWTCSTFALKPLVERDFVDEAVPTALQGHGYW